MASYYVRSGAGGAANGTSWADAYLTITAAVAAKSAGDIFYVAADHAESTAGAISFTFLGTSASPNLVYCVDHTGTVPPVHADLRTTAQIITTGTNSQTYSGNAYFYGIKFHSGTGAGSSSLTFANGGGNAMIFDNCVFNLIATGSAGTITFGASGVVSPYIRCNSCTFTTSNASQIIRPIGSVYLRNCTHTGTASNGLIVPFSNRPGYVYAEGCDFTNVTSGQPLVGINTMSVMPCVFKDCKTDSDGVLTTTPSNPGEGVAINFVNCDNGSTNYKMSKISYEGTLTTETTIVRTGGASDGTTPISWKIVTTANSEWYLPFECPPIAVWNDDTGAAITATVEGIWGGGAVPNNDEIWIDVQYPGEADSPRSYPASGSKASNLASASAHASSSETWGGSTTAFSMSATFTPLKAGWIYVYPKAAKVSSTFYVDPMVTLT